MGLGRYLMKRSIIAVLLIFLVATINFVIVHITPGGPQSIFVLNPHVSVAARQLMLAQFGLTKPLYVQYEIYIVGMFTGHWGISYFYNEPAFQVIAQRVPATLLLMVPSLILTILVGIVLGVLGARRPFSFVDRFLSSTAFFFYAMPAFWLGFVLLTVFVLFLHVLPASGMTSVSGGGSVPDILTHMILPVFSLTLVNLANFSLLMRSSLMEVMDQNYITTAKGKGLSERLIFFRHAMRNALLPTVTMTGLFVGFLLTGAILTESVFNWPGLGLLTFQSIEQRDYPIILSLFFIFSIMIIVANLVTDVLYGFLDPRISFD
ncbi:MAG TPA: ABC transporter permease [Nitrososphaerales archaeon]|nr:ABC transporter permease [Nitrososphaerales archaeon]